MIILDYINCDIFIGPIDQLRILFPPFSVSIKEFILSEPKWFVCLLGFLATSVHYQS